MRNKYEHIVHSIDPVYDSRSEILILGSLPSVRSREAGFFYGNPRNRFWSVLEALFGYDPFSEQGEEGQTDSAISLTDAPVGSKKAFLLKNHIALWDVIESCDIRGSSDASIKNAVANDVASLVRRSDVSKIFLNGRIAEKYYKKYLAGSLDIDAEVLPSTSPANAAWSTEKLIKAWSVIRVNG